MSTTVEPAELSYPDKPDANGYAKKYFKRRAFYFGAYNTPESFQLFGEWKRQLIESGQAPEVKAVRKDLAHQLAPKTPAADDHVERRGYLWPLVSIVSALIVSATILGSAKIVSSTIGPSVDGVILSDEEMAFVRGIRKDKDRFERSLAATASDVSQLTLKLMEEGPTNGNHRKKKDP